MNKKFTPSREQALVLEETAAKIAKLNHSGFNNTMEVGGHLVSAQNVLGSMKGAPTYWSKWVVNTLKMELRTAQLYRDVYQNFSPQAESPIEKFDVGYLATIGTTKLSRFHSLWKASSEGKYKDCGLTIALKPTIITLSYPGLDGKTETKDLADMSLSDLRLLMRGKKQDSSTAEKAIEVKDLLDALHLNPDGTRKVEILRSAIKLLQAAFLNTKGAADTVRDSAKSPQKTS